MRNLILIVITILYLLLMGVYWQTVSADESYEGAQKALDNRETAKALYYANKSIKKNPREPRYYYGRAKVLLGSDSREDALGDLEAARELNPNNLVTLRNMVPLYYFLATEQTYLAEAQKYFNEIKHYSPNDVGVYALLAKYENKLGLGKGMRESVENVNRLRPDLLEWYLVIPQ